MKILPTLAIVGMATLLSGCLEATLLEGRSIHRRPVGYYDTHHRGHYRAPLYSSGYRRNYYEGDRVYRTQIGSHSRYDRRSPGVRVHLR